MAKNRGRPVKATDELKAEYLAWLAAGAPAPLAARLCGVGEGTMRPARFGPEFREAVKAAIARGRSCHAKNH